MENDSGSDSSSDDQLHPNWVALATVHFKPKIFVRSSGTENDKTAEHESVKHQVEIDESASEAYKEILKLPSTAKKIENRVKSKRKRMKIEKVPFDKQNFFKLAMADEAEELKNLCKNSIKPDLNARDGYGWTALMMAACEGAVNTFRLLLELGADLSVEDRKGNSALSLAAKKGFQNIIEANEDYQPSLELIEISGDEDETDDLETLFCKDCGIEILKKTSKSHQTSTVHLFSCKFKGNTNIKTFGIARTNVGFKMMRRTGWNGNTGLGAKQDGKLYPIKTVLRKRGTGLGIEQDPAKITHFKANDPSSIKFRPPPRALTRKEIHENDIKDKRKDQRLRRELS